jgi:hypothetical protein
MAEKREKFVRLAENRVNRAIKDLRLIGNLSNKNNYSYTDSDIQKILVALDQEVRNLKARFSSDDGKTVPVFKI